jgi:hypothetical protein
VLHLIEGSLISLAYIPFISKDYENTVF